MEGERAGEKGCIVKPQGKRSLECLVKWRQSFTTKAPFFPCCLSCPLPGVPFINPWEAGMDVTLTSGRCQLPSKLSTEASVDSCQVEAPVWWVNNLSLRRDNNQQTNKHI